jgi:hypothetical protein
LLEDPFLEDLLGMIERGKLARIPGSILKGKIILKIQQYSAEIPNDARERFQGSF